MWALLIHCYIWRCNKLPPSQKEALLQMIAAEIHGFIVCFCPKADLNPTVLGWNAPPLHIGGYTVAEHIDEVHYHPLWHGKYPKNMRAGSRTANIERGRCCPSGWHSKLQRMFSEH